MKEKRPITDKWAIKKNEIMPFAATGLDLEIIILSEVRRKRQISYDVAYKHNVKKNTNELIYKTEMDSQRMNLWLPEEQGGRREGRNRLEAWDWHVHTSMFKMDNLQGLTV